jgi:hypothetical protein
LRATDPAGLWLRKLPGWVRHNGEGWGAVAGKRALVFRAGTVGLICAATEVELTPGTETTQRSMRPVRDCTNLATVHVRSGECVTAFCPDCAEAVRQSSNVGVVTRVIRRPELN